MREQTFTRSQVRKLLWIIGWLTPLNKLGEIYDRMNTIIESGEFSEYNDMLRLARGVWRYAGSYGVGTAEDPNCDIRKGE